jgi:NAD(P)-dependent dehydrogenase (short-subunit alcohol dehydrogenase family)
VVKTSYQNSQQLLLGKNILITGACANIGRSTAIESAIHGANVYFTDLHESDIKELENELNQDFQVKSKGFKSDVSQTNDNDLLIKQLSEAGIEIDILVNNVGIKLPNPSVREYQMADFDSIYKTNVSGPLYLTKIITNKMVKEKIKGSVIFLSSIQQWISRRNILYSSSKAAIGMIVESLAIDLLPHGIRVNSIAPGWVELDNKGRTKKARDPVLYKSSIPPSHIARAVVYLASDYFSKFTTGTVLKIDGGFSLNKS